jgi:hypothetical protein
MDLPDMTIGFVEVSAEAGSDVEDVAMVGILSLGRCGIARSMGGGTIVVTGGIGNEAFAVSEPDCVLLRASYEERCD